MSHPELDELRLLETLRQVIDPELGCNIVDLGLIYGITTAANKVIVVMTLTTVGCPMHESIALGVQRALFALPEVEEVQVNLVWDPPWVPSKASDHGRACLGMVSY
jgi:metal-sulfur cluster biosynthetic enzyme